MIAEAEELIFWKETLHLNRYCTIMFAVVKVWASGMTARMRSTRFAQERELLISQGTFLFFKSVNLFVESPNTRSTGEWTNSLAPLMVLVPKEFRIPSEVDGTVPINVISACITIKVGSSSTQVTTYLCISFDSLAMLMPSP